MNVLDHSKPHQRFFEEITGIPHGSYHEKPLSDYLVNFAQSHALEYIRDAYNNVIIFKPAAPGYEDHLPVALQAHMDMVWEKDEGYEHDFMTEPLKLILENNILTAEHTTLGIDDGSGLAYILAILDDPNAKHPPLQAIFTVQEEVGMLGAQAMDRSVISAERFIGLDCGGGDSIYVSSLGGRSFEIDSVFTQDSINDSCWEVSVSGLVGGYSTSYLSGAENAIMLISEILDALDNKFGIRIASVNGGRTGGKVASEAKAVFAVSAAEKDLYRYWNTISGMIKKDCLHFEGNAVLSMNKCEDALVMDKCDSERILHLLASVPCGSVQRNSHNGDLIGTVINLTCAETNGGRFSLHGTVRSESNRKLDLWTRKIDHICKCCNADLRMENGFPAWEYDPDSKMVRKLKEVFHEVTGDELGSEEVQGGIECSIFMQADHPMDMVTLGPFGDKVHTTDEYADMNSYDRIFEVFTAYLASL